MDDSPLANRTNGRGKGGRFARGNTGGPGNPFGRRVARLRSVLLDSVGDEDLKEIVVALAAKAKAGDLAAVKLLLAYAVGTPSVAPDPDRLATVQAINEADRLEAEDRKRENTPSKLDRLLDDL